MKVEWKKDKKQEGSALFSIYASSVDSRALFCARLKKKKRGSRVEIGGEGGDG